MRIRKQNKSQRERLSEAWFNMKYRCYKPSFKGFHNYGGRGITVCDEWRNSFSAFIEWAVANGYRDDLQLDRIDPNGNYEPSNCRWASRSVQARNQRKRRGCTSIFRGVNLTHFNRWISTIRPPYGEKVNLGYFRSAAEAAIAYDNAAIQILGPDACLNFPLNGGKGVQVITPEVDQEIAIGDSIKVMVLRVEDGSVKLGIISPTEAQVKSLDVSEAPLNQRRACNRVQ